MYKLLSINILKAVLMCTAFMFSISSFAQNLVINEIMASNATYEYDKTTYNFSNWIELYNPTNANINLNGYVLHSSKDDARYTFSYKYVPAGGFLRLWTEGELSSDHVPVKLDSEGGYIELIDNKGNIIDKLGFGKQFTNVSFGRYPDGSKNIGFLLSASPNASNIGPCGIKVLPAPVFYQKGGICKSALNVSIQVAGAPDAEVHFTLDGSEPTILSPLYQHSISINKSTVVRAKTFSSAAAPSVTSSQSYIFPNHTTTLPIVCLSVDPLYLNNNTIGILVDGTNGAQGNCTDKYVNWNQKWERASHLEFYEKDGRKLIDQYIGIQVAGACSRNNPQKSLTLKARPRYGNDKFDCPDIYPYKKVKSFSQFMLRNSGNDFDQTSFRDDMIQNLCRNYTQLDYQASRSVAVYINAEYWGVMSLREKSDENLISSNYNLKENEFDILENNAYVVQGSNSEYNALINYLNTNDLSVDKNYSYVSSKIDINNYLDYMVSEIYASNTDWPGNNIVFWKPQMPTGKWRWVLKDMDFGFSLWNSGFTHNTLTFALDPNGPGWPNPDWSTLLFRKLMSNASFKEAFKRRFTQHLATTYNPKRVNAIIDSMQNDLVSEMPYHLVRWGLSGTDNWNYQVQLMRDFANNRPAVMSQYINDFYGGGGMKNLQVSCHPSTGGGFVIGDGIFASSSVQNTIPAGDIFEFKAIPSSGFKYVGTEIHRGGIIEYNLLSDNTIWKYFTDINSPATDWYTENYIDDSWPQGESQLGYGDGDEKTVIPYGSDAQNKFISSYFRKKFYIEDINKIDSVQLWALYDDGIDIYLNDKEIRRVNLPDGELTSSTLAFQSDDNAIANWLKIDKTNLKTGWNTLAAEVHQTSANSSDLSFDLKLKGFTNEGNSNEETAEQTFNIAIDSNLDLVFKFEVIQPIKDLIINELMVNNTLFPNEKGDYEGWIELLNNGSSSITTSEIYVSDDSTLLTKWKIPNYNQLPLSAGAFMLLYADNKINNGWNHLPFKLSSNGGSIYISNKSGDKLTILDKVNYGKIYGNKSYARVHDGSKEWKETAAISPGKSNVSVGINQFIKNEINIFPNPTHDNAIVTVNENNAKIEICSIQGRKLKEYSTATHSITISLSEYPKGLYLINVITDKGTTQLKLVKD